MCGIAGFADFKPAAEGRLLSLARNMTDTIVHRGPDAGGVWADAEAGYATGSRRLKIVDLTEAGAQPMVSQSGRFVLSYNGEVYNAADIRPELEAKGYRFRGHSDTEVILEACEEWGVQATAKRLIGMFAFALWDRKTRRLCLVRDRFGIKPLYWGQFGDLTLFSSELKGLRAHPDWPVEIDQDAIAAYLRFGYISAPKSIYRNVFKLPPGTILEIDARSDPKIEPFWTLDDVIRDGRRDSFEGSDAEAEEELNSLLGDAVKRRMIADVPLGAFLSGGIDSSTVVALMQAQRARPVRTFSIGFHEKEYNEAPYAKAVARHLGTDHTELYVTPEEALSVIPRLPEIYDEPFADSSQIPTYLVSALTREHVTVALSGDGGDEVFCGYPRYFRAAELHPRLAAVPRPLRSGLAGALRSISPGAWNRLQRVMPQAYRLSRFGEKLHKLADVLLQDEDKTYLSLLSLWQQPELIFRNGQEPAGVIGSAAAYRLMPNYLERMQYFDLLGYLPDDILTKLDRASMAVSLEARVPLIDHRVVAFAWRLPVHMKWRDGKSKWILRQVLRRYVPDSLIDRPKMGFGVPIDHWLRGPLRDWSEHHLSPEALVENGLNPELIRTRWASHLAGNENWQYPLWSIISLQAWLKHNAATLENKNQPPVAA